MNKSTSQVNVCKMQDLIGAYYLQTFCDSDFRDEHVPTESYCSTWEIIPDFQLISSYSPF